MELWKKMVLSFLGVAVALVIGVCAYGIKIYSDANSTVKSVYESVERISSKRDAAVNIDAQEPFSVLLMGVDNGDLGREADVGRSDTTIVVTVNPKEKKSTMISLDRDILTELVGNGTNDKLNHAFAYGGAKMAIETVENLLDIPIDHYVSINMKGMKDLIDAIGGIQVDNTLGEFTLDGIVVPAGHVTLNGETGLAYARMRYEDPEGDVGRQRRQREVVEKIVQKAMSFGGVSKYKSILHAVESNVKTDLSWDDMIDIQSKYLASFEKIDSLQLEGEGQTIDGVYYQILNPQKLYEVQTKLRKQLGLPKNEELAASSYEYEDYGSSDSGVYEYTEDTSEIYYTEESNAYVENENPMNVYEDSTTSTIYDNEAYDPNAPVSNE